MFEEPEINPLDDTHPTGTYPQVNLQGEDDTSIRVSQNRGSSGAQRFLGLILLLGAFGLTVGTVILLTSPTEMRVITVTNTPTSPAVVMTTQEAGNAETQATGEVGEIVITEDIASIDELLADRGSVDLNALPTLSADTAAQLLQTPIAPILIDNPQRVVRAEIDAFTIIPDRPRNTMIKYTIQQGDTIYDIAQRFGLTQESIAWSNDRSQIWTLIPGDELNIPPVDGVYVQMIGGVSIRQIAEQYGVSDVDTVLESEANPQLRSLSPDTVPPSGTWIFIPGGVAEEVNWAPQIEVTGGDGSSGSSGGNLVSFQSGDPGSCQPMPPGTATGWGNPLNFGSYTVTRGYSSWHPGIDLSAAPGTPVLAANGGTIIFAGRNNWGYGIAVVISSGPFATLYGHLSGTAVGCGQTVGTGQVIGYVGSTGNSSGPHLHFEILYNGVRGDPGATLAF
jgi:murein DD-endopeptidase MepM/ murein hydrolase activator NlpD